MRTVDPAIWSKNKQKLGVKPTWLQAQSPEVRARASLKDAFNEYLSHCTLKGLGYAMDKSSSKYIRRCYMFIIICLFISGTLIVTYTMNEHRSRAPLQVNLQTSADGPLVDFPAIAICSNCAVTESALHEYAEGLVIKDNNSTYTIEEIKELLRNFGAIISNGQPKYENLQFLRFLHKVDSKFNVTDLMYKLAPKCSSILKKCAWRGHVIDCKLLFAKRATPLGYCCVFNSRYQWFDTNNRPKTLDTAGHNTGLSVAVNENRNDFSFIRRPMVGSQILLFDGNEYPLLESGAVRAYIVGVNESVFFQLTAQVQKISPKVERLAETRRGCRITQPGPRTPRSSYSWCLTYCRRFTMQSVCNCVHYYMLPNTTDNVCTTEHLQCLYKHKAKMVYYFPGKVKDSSLDEELQDSLMCGDCIPDCARLLHTAAVFHTTYHYPKKLLTNQFSAGLTYVNTTILRFYYATINHNVYNVDINMSWDEGFAHLSCQMWFILGGSMTSLAELVFFLTCRWSYHFWRRTQQMKGLNRLY